MHQNKNTSHQPVLLGQVLHYLAPQTGESYLDLTAGYGGHAESIMLRAGGRSILVDRDDNATEFLAQQWGGDQVAIRHQDFLTASQELAATGERFDMILADLGVSSPHLNIASRGFSISRDGPLDMRMDRQQSLTAANIVNEYSVEDIAQILLRYGEEPKARQIAVAIVAARPLATTSQLAEIVARAWRKKGMHKVHPATRTFQALRIAVNDELSQLEQALPLWHKLLAPGGRLAVISFHSLEDRIVKQYFAEHAGNRYDADLRLLTKKPVQATTEEVISNPRSRSAKLRVAVKIKTKKGGL